MKALTLQQPWATLIAEGHKRVENRTWQTAYRGPLAIHAGLKVDPAGLDLARWMFLACGCGKCCQEAKATARPAM